MKVYILQRDGTIVGVFARKGQAIVASGLPVGWAYYNGILTQWVNNATYTITPYTVQE